MKILFLVLGIVSLVIGFVGIFTPILPTTPFLILAAVLFSKSSATFYDWLIEHRLLGPPIQNWKRNGSINFKSKVLAATMLTFSGVFIFLKPSLPQGLRVLTLLMLVAIASFILSRPTR